MEENSKDNSRRYRKSKIRYTSMTSNPQASSYYDGDACATPNCSSEHLIFFQPAGKHDVAVLCSTLHGTAAWLSGIWLG